MILPFFGTPSETVVVNGQTWVKLESGRWLPMSAMATVGKSPTLGRVMMVIGLLGVFAFPIIGSVIAGALLAIIGFMLAIALLFLGAWLWNGLKSTIITKEIEDAFSQPTPTSQTKE